MLDSALFPGDESASSGESGFQPYSLVEISGCLLPGEALLDVQVMNLRNEDVILLLVLPQETRVTRIVSLDGPQLKALLAQWRTRRAAWRRTIDKLDHFRLPTGRASQQAGVRQTKANLLRELAVREDAERDALQALGMFILGETMPLLRDAGISTLIVSPDGLLHQVPFAALRVPDAGGRICDLIDLVALQLVPTASSLVILRNQHDPETGWVPNLLAAAPFGDFLTGGTAPDSSPEREEPHFGGRVWRDLEADDTTRALPASDDEIEDIAAILRASAWRAEVLHGPDATREAILARLPRVNILHLSTHGSRLIANDPIMRYRILLANRTSIQVQDIYDDLIAMQHVWLVCLSACHLGEVVLRGVDALGFSQAFLEAGVRVVLMPIWAVDDAASAALMKEWYGHLVENDRPDVTRAWQRAVQKVKSRKHWSSPIFWAGFLPVGDGALRLAALPHAGSVPGSD